jgi:hypothetical protein
VCFVDGQAARIVGVGFGYFCTFIFGAFNCFIEESTFLLLELAEDV